MFVKQKILEQLNNFFFFGFVLAVVVGFSFFCCEDKLNLDKKNEPCYLSFSVLMKWKTLKNLRPCEVQKSYLSFNAFIIETIHLSVSTMKYCVFMFH